MAIRVASPSGYGAPLNPVYPFNAPGESIKLYDGPVTGPTLGKSAGEVVLDCRAGDGLLWKIRHGPEEKLACGDTFTLCLTRRGAKWNVEAHSSGFHVENGSPPYSEGWLNRAVYGKRDASVSRVVLSWMNLPKISGNVGLVQSSEHGIARWSNGRLQVEVDEWLLTLDVRPDHSKVMKNAKRAHLFLLTHVMELRRVDGRDFRISEAEAVLECLRVVFSFAFGRWVAPVLPVGYDSMGDVVWEHWYSPICDRAKSLGSPWLCKNHTQDVVQLIECSLQAFKDPHRSGVVRHQMALAVQSAESGFLEQRILSAAPALEHVAWANLVLGGRFSPAEYRDRYAEDRLRFLLREADVSTAIDPVALPGLADFAHQEGMDGPTAVTRVRNRLIHPQDVNDQIYRHEGLVMDVWLLTRHYVTMLILYSIGYRGSIGDLLKPARWAGETISVPWENQTTQRTIELPPTKAEVNRARRRRRSS